MIDFSVIIPHYNIPDCLERLIDSIPAKDNFEIIVVDDKSDKNLEQLALLKEKYKGTNCSFYDNDTEHKGAGVCRNIGVSRAKGKWLLFADSDDFFTKDMYDTVCDCVNREEDIIFFFPTSINLDTGLESDRHIEFCNALSKYVSKPDESNELVLRYQVVSPWSKMIRRSMVVDNNIEFEGTRVANDVLFCRKIGHHAKSIAVDERVIYTVTQRQGSLTTFIGKDAYMTRLGVFIRSTNYVRGVVDKATWKKMRVNGSYFLHMCRANKLGVTVILQTVVMLIKNGISPV